MLASVCHFLREKLWLACQIRLPADIGLELVHSDASLLKCLFDVLQVLLSVQTNLDAASALADTLHVILIECHINHVFGS